MRIASIKALAKFYPIETAVKIRRALEGPGGVRARLEEVDRIIGGFGVEYVGRFSEYPPVEHFRYVNTGDAYSITIIYRDGVFSVGCWGEMVESLERRGVRFD